MKAEQDIVNQEAILQRKDDAHSDCSDAHSNPIYINAQCQPKEWDTQLFNLFLS